MAAPTDIIVSGGSLREGEANGVIVATLSTVDADIGDTFTYALTDPSGAFEIVGNQIRVLDGALIDFETAAAMNVTVEVTDGSGNTYSEPLAIAVQNLNDVTGTSGDDFVSGTSGDDIIQTFGGNDTINNVGQGSAPHTRSADIVDAGDGNDLVSLNGFYGPPPPLDPFNPAPPPAPPVSTITLGGGVDTVGFDSPPNLAIEYATITDFTTGPGGDQIDLLQIISVLHEYIGDNPFGSGYIRLVQQGADTLLQVDQDAGGTSSEYYTVLRFQNVDATSFTADNFVPAWPTDGSVPAGQTIVGTDNFDTLTGTLGADTIQGLDGNDFIDGDAGNDTIYGGLGDDVILGGRGIDTVYGEEGNDFISIGGAGSVDGGAGNDFLVFKGGPSYLTGTMVGGDGDDTLENLDGFSNATLDGGAGNDTIRASQRFGVIETILGGDGNDTIESVGYGSADTVDAGSGNDTVRLFTGPAVFDPLNPGAPPIVPVSTITLGSGQDVLGVNGLVGPFAYIADITDFSAGAGGDKIDLSFFSFIETNPFGTHIQLLQDGGDTLLQVDATGSGGAAGWSTWFRLQNTNAGDFTAENFSPAWPTDGSIPPGQTIIGTPGDDVLAGAPGDDTIDGLDGNDIITGDPGDDIIHGGSGSDRITDTFGNNQLFGDGGADIIEGTGLLDGGPGNDQLRTFGGTTISSTLLGGDGDDILEDNSIGGALLDGGAGNDQIRASHSNAPSTIFGGDGSDIISNLGIGSGDIVDAGAGNDTVIFNGFAPPMLLDPVTGLPTTTDISSTVTLGSGQDVLKFGGYSMLTFQAATVTDFTPGAGGDKIDLREILQSVVGYTGGDPAAQGYLRMIDDGPDSLFQVDRDGGANGENWQTIFRLQNTNPSQFVMENFILPGDTGGGTPPGSITGTPGNDSLTGTPGNDVIFGLGGNDFIDGTAGNDQIFADDGNDTLIGGQGDDLLDGGAGGGFDEVRYDQDAANGGPGGVSVNLETGSAIDGFGNNDILNEIEMIRGTSQNDYMIGNAAIYNGFTGLAGDDYFDGNGGATDEVRYDRDAAYGGTGAVTVNLATGTATDGFGDTDTFVGINRVRGTSQADSLTGSDAGFEQFSGLGGADFIDGGAGTNDEVRYDSDVNYGGTAGVTVDLAAGTATDGFGDTDTLVNIENIRGTRNDDSVTGDATDNFIRGLQGDDLIDGGDGSDWTSYRSDIFSGPVLHGATVDLAAGTATDMAGGTDTLVSIENVDGSILDDDLSGDSGANRFRGLAGDDVIDGRDGVDTVDYSRDASVGSEARYAGFFIAPGTNGVNVNLQSGLAIDGFGDSDTLIDIENVVGTTNSDNLVGDGGVNVLSGLNGSDLLRGGAGDDVLDGGDGSGGSFGGGDRLYGGAGNDTLIGGGGTDFDWARYDEDAAGGGTAGVTVNLATGQATDGFGDTDTLSGIEIVMGTMQADTITGDGGPYNAYFGLAGDDVFDGGGGQDEARYDADAGFGGTGAASVDLAAGTATDGFGDTDTLININRVRGTQSGDILLGSEANNVFHGYAGNDLIDGRGGIDLVRYDTDANSGGTGAVTVDLAAGSATDGFGNTDTLVSIEDVRATHQADTLLGSAARNMFTAYGGADYIDGRGGSDWVSYQADIYTNPVPANGVFVDLASGSAIDSFGSTDTLVSIENVEGTVYDDVLLGDAGDNVFRGSAGTDSIAGGDGQDTVDYSRDADQGAAAVFGGYNGPSGASGVTVDLQAATATDAFGDTDTLSSIENVIGTRFDDVLSGSNQANVLDGRGGANTLAGRGGSDIFVFDTTDPAPRADVVTDFSVAEGDRVDLGTNRPATFADFLATMVSTDLAGNTVIAGGPGQTMTLLGVAPSSLTPESFGYVAGSTSNDTLEGNSASEVVDAGDGNDTITSGGGNDVIDAGAGNDTVNITGEYDVAQVSGGDGNDTVHGGDYMDIIDGGEGSDFIYGGAGADQLAGGGGKDFFFDEDGMAGDSYSGGEGYDRVTYSGGGAYDFSAPGADTFDASVENVIFNDTVTVTGTTGNDTFTAYGAGSTLDGGDGDDILVGTTGDETLLGGAGNDRLYAGTGSDFIRGGQGSDNMSGGIVGQTGDGQSDTFFYTLSDINTIDRIRDFEAGIDKFGLDAESFGLAPGALDASRFYHFGETVTQTGPVFIYNGATGTLYFDPNGSEAGGFTTMAYLTGNPELTANDFLVI